MKLDQEYLKRLILNIEEIPSPRLTLEQILNSVNLSDLDDDFLLHYEILRDYGFIEGVESPSKIGLVTTDDSIIWYSAHIRLTAKGHEFASALNTPEIWSVLKEKFKQDSIDTLFNVSKELLVKVTKKKLEQILSDEI